MLLHGGCGGGRVACLDRINDPDMLGVDHHHVLLAADVETRDMQMKVKILEAFQSNAVSRSGHDGLMKKVIRRGEGGVVWVLRRWGLALYGFHGPPKFLEVFGLKGAPAPRGCPQRLD